MLTNDGTLWMNLGDCYNAYNGNRGTASQFAGKRNAIEPRFKTGHGLMAEGLKPKDLVGIPWMIAFELRRRGWYLRSDIIWAKPNPMPESVTDRPTKAHEYIFLLSKSDRYFYDCKAIREPGTWDSDGVAWRGPAGTHDCLSSNQGDGPRVRTKGNRRTFRGGGKYTEGRSFDNSAAAANDSIGNVPNDGTRNKRTVWTVATEGFPDAHFATYPRKLIEPCILAGSAPGDTVLDPFMGSGTTAWVAKELGRRAIGCEINADYIALVAKRMRQEVLPLGA